jgi:hypothetical protein
MTPVPERKRPCTPLVPILEKDIPHKMHQYATAFLHYLAANDATPFVMVSCLCRVLLGHRVQCASILEPLDLGLVESVVQLDLERLTVFGVYPESHGLTDCQLRTEQVNLGENMRVSIPVHLTHM